MDKLMHEPHAQPLRAAADGGSDAYRPQLISRHSSCLPMAHMIKKKTSKLFSRRCRSASPPVKKKTITAIMNADSEGSSASQFSSIEEICYKLQQKESHGGITQRPIIKHLTSNFSVKQPKAVRLGSSSSSRVQVLSTHKYNLSLTSVMDRISFTHQNDFSHVLSPADVNGNLIKSSSVLASTAAVSTRRNSSKQRKVRAHHSKSFSQPDELFDLNMTHWLEEENIKPARKRRTSYCSVSPLQASHFDRVLPIELKLKIMSYLDHHDKGVCMLVSRSWYSLAKEPVLWQNIDFRTFKLCYGHDRMCASASSVSAYQTQSSTSSTSEHLERDCFSDESYPRGASAALVEMEAGGDGTTAGEWQYTRCGHSCYTRYMSRIDRFISFLIDLQPRVKQLSFAFDIVSDNWLSVMKKFLLHLNLKELEYAYLNWRDTPVKPYSAEEDSNQLSDVLYKTRRRQKCFMDFLELFVTEAPNVMTLILPFCWSPRSTRYLISLKKLRYLTLEKYFVLQTVSQEDLYALSKMKQLERLVLEIWNPSSPGIPMYCIKSKTLKYLDLSQCRGFYVYSLDLPSLEVFITVRSPWNGSLTFTNQLNIRCLQDILSVDTPNILRINNHYISEGSSVFCPELSPLFKKLCPCQRHKSSILM